MWGKPALSRALAVLLALAVWQLAASLLDIELLLVSPVRVLARLSALVREGDFWQALLFSLSRIAAGFALGFVCGTAAAFAAARFRLLETLLWPYVAVIKAVPVASFIILALMWLRARELSVFIAFLMVFPILYQNVLEGLKSCDPLLLEMAQSYRIPFGRRLRGLYLPQVRPYLLSGASVALGLSWKAGVAAELIGVASGSVGERLYEAKVYFLTADLFAWTLVIVLASVAFEKLVLALLRAAVRRASL